MMRVLERARWEEISPEAAADLPAGQVVAVLHGGVVSVGAIHSVYKGSIYLQSDRPHVRRHAGRFPAAVVSVVKEEF